MQGKKKHPEGCFFVKIMLTEYTNNSIRRKHGQPSLLFQYDCPIP